MSKVLIPGGYVSIAGGIPTIHYYQTDHLGNIRQVLSSDGVLQEQNDYYAFGMRQLREDYPLLASNKYKYNGKELETFNNFETLDYGARFYDPELARWHSVDPLTESYYSQSPYHFSGNNPIRLLDLNGMNYGDYYKENGTWLGSDGIVDDKVYIADAVTLNNQGTVKKAENAKELSISHTEFQKQAATVYVESSAYKMNSVTSDLKKEMFAIASVHQSNSLAYGANSDKAKEYLALSPSEINNSKFKTTANAAVINAVTGGIDYSYGATMWDGREQSFFPATDNRGSNGKWELHMNTMGWNISDSHYNTWKTNVGAGFNAPQQKASPANFGNYNNKGMMRLQSTAVYGETIFWKIK